MSLPRSVAAFAALIAAAGTLPWLSGCASAGASTRLTQDDFDVTTQEMVDSLAGSDFLRGRDGSSERIVIVIDKVENLTSDIIPPAEQWTLMWRLQSALPVRSLRTSKNVAFMLPADRLRLIAEARRAAGEPPLPGVEPTHMMRATFYSSTRRKADSQAPANQRVEWYSLGYSVVDLRSREIVWQDQFDFKRQALGSVIE